VEPAVEAAKKSFSAAELDHVPRYIAPDEDRPQESPAASQPRAVTADWQPNELASFSGAEWVPPAVGEDEARSYVAPKATSTAPRRSPRNLIIATVGVALVAGLGFGVSKALAPDTSKIVVETTTVTTAAKRPEPTTALPTTVASRPGGPALVGVANTLAAKSEAAVENALETSTGDLPEPVAPEASAP
jgi:hypothetical protein